MDKDFIAELRKEQVELGKKYANDIVNETPPEIVGLMSEAHTNMIVGGMKFTVIEAILLYTDWLACQLVRSKNFNKQPLPAIDKKATSAFTSKEGGMGARFLKSFLPRLTRPGTILPLVGKIAEDGELVPNKDALKKWASMYRWE